MHAFARARRRRGTTVAASLTAVLATALTTVVAVLPTSTAQAAVPVVAGPAAGPIDPNTGYPFWYADGTGEKFELCLDRPDTTAGMCLAAPRNPSARPWTDEDPAQSNLAEDPEAFWYNADADIRQGGVRARFIAAQEATFGGPDSAARAGEQIAFARVRVRLTGMVPGANYTVTDPYDAGTRTYTADDGGRVFVTRDIGCLDVPCDFTKPYKSSVTSYLRWDPSVGPAAPTGYVGDPGVAHEVVGAPSGNNFFRVVGPDPSGPGNVRLETNQFNVQGRLWNPTQPMLGLDSTQNLLDFGKVMLGATMPAATQTVTLTNAGGGTTPLLLGALDVTGANSTQFTLSNDKCSSASLLPGATCTVDVSYTPAAVAGPVKAQLNVPSNGKDSVGAVGGQRILLKGRVSDGTGKDARITGPIDRVNGFPQWYQDETGQRVALCDDPKDPMCVLPTTPEGTYNPALPMKFATNYPGELFWWNADASIDNLTNTETGNAVRARLVLGEEAAFVNGDAAPGDQIAFGRIRIRVSDLQLGQTYHVVTPYLERDFVAEDDGKGGGEINYTEDIGCLETPCNFDRVNQSNIGPFLRQTNAPKGYLGDPNVTDTVTGGPISNKFVISGPGVAGETDQFAVSGKLLTVPAATGQLNASSTTVKVNPGQQGTAVTLTNVGNAPSAIPAVTLVGNGFAIINNGCTAAVAPAASCTVTVGVTTAKPGDTATLQVTNGAQPPIVVTLQRPGGGVAAPTAPALLAASNTGISAFDTLTNLNTVTVSGAAATGQAVQVLVDGTPVQTVTAVAGTFSAPLNLTEGVHTVTAVYDGQTVASAPVTVQVDTTAPVVPTPHVVTDVANGSLTGALSWSGHGSSTFEAQVSGNWGAFVPLALSGADATHVEHRLVSGARYRFRVRGTDAAGNVSDWSGITVSPSLVQEGAGQVRYDGRWVRRTAEGASGHGVRSSATRGSTATIRTTADSVDIVAPTGPRRGQFAVRVNGRHVRTVDLYSARPERRQTVATLHGLSSQQASVVQLRVLGTKRHASGGTRVTLDAFLLTR